MLESLSTSCRMEGLRFLSLQARATQHQVPSGEALYADHSLQVDAVCRDGGLRVVLGLDVLARPSKDAPPFLELNLRLEVTYRVPAAVPPTTAVLGAFSFMNAAQTAWPFFREAVLDLGAKCGFPGMLLPIRRVLSDPRPGPIKPGRKTPGK
ncbi:MAG: hypothetical protein HY814_11525 [Candidatus Riflebacteria bacterium]|nr:hypothetical protein [Candidatus Riflebacteria bacterium]